MLQNGPRARSGSRSAGHIVQKSEGVVPARRPLGDSVVRIFLTVGTDHHPFDRLILWLDHWFEVKAAGVSCLAQTGPSIEPIHARSEQFLTYEEVWAAMRGANVIVSHAAPGSVLIARNLGHRPVVVPRRREFGEAVDNHQVAFARWLALKRIARVAEDEASFQRAIEQVLATRRFRRPRVERPPREVARRFGELIDELLARDRRS